VGPRAVEGLLDVAAALLPHRRLKALQGAGLPEAEGGTQRCSSWRL